MATTDTDRVERHKEEATVVFDDSLQGKEIDGINTKAGLDFKDQGRVRVPFTSGKNLYVGTHKFNNPKFDKGYDDVEWHCSRCDRMHKKSEECYDS